MTIKEIEKLNKDSLCGVLRCPQSLKRVSREDLFKKHSLFKLIIDNIIRNKDCEHFLNSMFGKRKMKLVANAKIKSSNQTGGWFKVDSMFGSGFFCDAHNCFQDGCYPEWIVKQFCFNNTHLYILATGIKAKILSGIMFVGKPFLHSVLQIGENILDFNYDLVMSKDLFCELTSFEVLEELDSETLLKHKDLLMNNRKHLDMPAYQLNFAFDEVVENLQNKLANGQICEEIIKKKKMR